MSIYEQFDLSTCSLFKSFAEYRRHLRKTGSSGEEFDLSNIFVAAQDSNLKWQYLDLPCTITRLYHYIRFVCTI